MDMLFFFFFGLPIISIVFCIIVHLFESVENKSISAVFSVGILIFLLSLLDLLEPILQFLLGLFLLILGLVVGIGILIGLIMGIIKLVKCIRNRGGQCKKNAQSQGATFSSQSNQGQSTGSSSTSCQGSSPQAFFQAPSAANKRSSSARKRARKRKPTIPPPPPIQGGWFNTVQGASPSSSSEILEVFDPKGEPLVLGEKDTLASGGEGTVYTLPISPHFLVKIYKDKVRQDSQKMQNMQRRLKDMLTFSSCLKKDFLAWPQMEVRDAQKATIGFLMRKVEGKTFQRFQGGPAIIQKTFPSWTRKELALTALDFVQKVRFLAAQGILVNDFNPANFLVNEQCQVRFIDCDSYQIPGKNGEFHLTHTHFPAFAAPELLNQPEQLKSPRTLHQVEFCTAQIVFLLIMCGLHPYSYHNRKKPGGTPEENLRQGLCPLRPPTSRNPTPLFPEGPWNNLWSTMNDELKTAFASTFLEGHGNPQARVPLRTLEYAISAYCEQLKKKPNSACLMPPIPQPFAL